ncbi:Initiation factor eIF-4 gamma [Cinnamomum micranthum f. kanehirae]|uniref:Initiation factor eIF-4 gamma n=1 Tax=Cinnamomum micranthum f. kanehirae TaxID=337451 RepID=A0A3S3MQR8_9MAGN|nr:Initiation factor eIF-4 gamma [Cinnamomum micranthum f. kanehirae]
MDFNDSLLSEEHKELLKSATESVDPISSSTVEVTACPKAPNPHQGKHGTGKGSPVKNDRHPHSGRDGRPKKGGKGTWGGLLETGDDYAVDLHDPNYDSNEEDFESNASKLSAAFDEYRKKATVIVEEYFATDDVVSTANELRDLGWPSYHHYFVKKLVSMAMDRHDKEKEMAAVLLSTIYADVIDPPQVYLGFTKLVEAADDLVVDIPDTVDVLALFVARAVVDDILPPAFLTKQMVSLPKDSKGMEVIKRAEKGYLSAPLHAEIIERRWGGSNNKTVEDVKAKINNLLIEYVVSGDKTEALRCIKHLKVPFFHHEIVKRALIMAMDRRAAEGLILDLLKDAAEEGVINSSQMTKGFSRLIDTIDDLSLDILSARDLLQSLISKAASEGWLCASSLKSLSFLQQKQLEESEAGLFKMRVTSIIQEYFLTKDVFELITLALDRKNREKEMASVLLTSLGFPHDDVVSGFVLLIEAAEDTALDIPVVVEDLAMFLARAVVDEVLAPLHLDEIGSQCVGQDSIGKKVLQMARSLLKARLSAERILRCWGGGGSSRTGWEIEDIKDKIGKLLEEYDSGGDAREARRCIKDLGMPFFHHEVVKKALVTVMEKKNERLWGLLGDCFCVGLITMNQMTKGFTRVADCIDDLALDIPDVKIQYAHYVERAKIEGWLDSSFSTA